jgi:nucleotide-binding universal stress UspA family protein
MSTKINNILVPVDFTEYSNNSLEVAVQIAKRNNAKLTALHILDFSSMTMSDAKILFKDNFSSGSIEDRSFYLLSALKDRIRYKYQFDIDTLIKKGMVVSSIIKTSEEINIDLIVIGTHGTGDRAIFLGSHAYFIVIRSLCPVLAIPKSVEQSPFTKLFFPGKAINNPSEQCDFIEKIIKENDIVLGVPGLIKDSGKININVLNEKINFLGNKLIGNGIKSPEKIQDTVNLIKDNLKYVTVDWIKIQEEELFLHGVSNTADRLVPIFSLVDY